MIDKQPNYRNQIKHLLKIDNPRIMLIKIDDAIVLRKGGIKCYELCGGLTSDRVFSMEPTWWFVLTGPNAIMAALSYGITVSYSLTEFLAIYKGCAVTLVEEFGLANNNRHHEVIDLITLRDIQTQNAGDFDLDFWYDTKTGKVRMASTII